MTAETLLGPARRARIEALVAGAKRRPVLVVDVGWANGLGAIRTFAAADVPVLALDHRPWALGLRSRYALPVLTPDPADKDAYIAFIGELLSLLPEPVPAFATHDDSLEAVARAAAEHAGKILCPFPEWPRLEEVQQKKWQLAQAEAAGVAAPRTAHPATAAEAQAFAAEAGYPVLFKPSDPIGFRKAYKLQGIQCRNPTELEDGFAKMEPYQPMLQELIPGADEELYTLGSVISQRELEPLGLFCGRKLLQTPPVVGSCRLGEALWQPEVVEQGVRLLQHARVNGVSQVEFKRDPRDGMFKLMEINPRLWQWHTLARACGVNLPLIAYRDLLGEKVEPVTTEGEKGKWAVAILGGEKAVVPRPPFTEGVLSLRDPKPSAVHLVSVFRRWKRQRGRSAPQTPPPESV